MVQLLPVKDRLKNCNYQNSAVLHEICDAQRLCLTRCRRSSVALFTMLVPENIEAVPNSAFGSAYAERHLTFTNKKRIEINHVMMDRIVHKKKKPLILEKIPIRQELPDGAAADGHARDRPSQQQICRNLQP